MEEPKQFPVYLIACRVFEHLVERILPANLLIQIQYLDYGLHQVPRNLRSALQTAINQIDQPGLVILGYGLCGNGLHGIASGKHILLAPRMDDCIAMMFGSYAEYHQQFESRPGTYFLTKGWLESGSQPLAEFQRYTQKYGLERAAWLMDQQYHHYRRLAFIAHHQADLDQYREKALEVAEYCRRWGMDYEEILGSDFYLRRLFEVALALDQVDSDFIVVPPGATLDQSQYLR